MRQPRPQRKHDMVARLTVIFAEVLCLAVIVASVMDNEAAVVEDVPSDVDISPPSSPVFIYPSTPQSRASPSFETPSSPARESPSFDTPSIPATPTDERTPNADPPTPATQFNVHTDSPDCVPAKRIKRPSLQSSESTKRQLLMEDGSNAIRESLTPRLHIQPPADHCVPPTHHVQPVVDHCLPPPHRVNIQSPPLHQDGGPASDSDDVSDTDSELMLSEGDVCDIPPCDLDSCEEESSQSEDESSEESVVSDGSDEEDSLYQGANLTLAESVVKCMDLYVKHCLTKECLKDILKTLSAVLPESHVLPTTTYQLFKYVENFSFVPPAEKYYYCSDTKCFTPKDSSDQKCTNCGSVATSKVFHFPLADQIKFFFEKKRLAQAIDSFQSCQIRDGGLWCDIYHGDEYKEVRSNLKGRYDLVLQWNTDGVSVTKSSPASMWYLLCFPCEVSPQLRSSYMLVAGVWYDTKKPPMNMFLRPFVRSLKNIKESGGVEWTDSSTGEKFNSVVVAPILVADAPATAEATVTQYFSAKYGCNTCEQKRALVQIKTKTGSNLDNASRNVRRFVFEEDAAPLRTGKRMDEQGMQAEEKMKPIKGVLGKAVVSEMPFFDRALGVAAEYMHVVLLGVVKYFTLVWLETNGPWCIKKHAREIDSFLREICVPYFVNRPTTGGLQVKFWKASEWRSWLLFYSLPALRKILPTKFYQHWILLVKSIHILLSEQITSFELENADIMLRMFVRDVKPLYGEKYYSYNVHQLLHLCLSVKRWGPLRGTSAFPFESHNAVLGSLIHGTKHKGQELVNQVKLVQGVIALKNFVERSKQGKKNCTLVWSCRGKPISIKLDHDQQAALSKCNIANCVFYRRVEKEGVVYSSLVYDMNKKKVNSFVKFCHEDTRVGYARIVFFVKSCDEVYALLKIFAVDHVKTIFHEKSNATISHVVPVKESCTLLTVPLNRISSVVMKVGAYFVSPPNLTEHNL